MFGPILEPNCLARCRNYPVVISEKAMVRLFAGFIILAYACNVASAQEERALVIDACDRLAASDLDRERPAYPFPVCR